jgi:Flp pilus assembly protein TadD
MATEWIRLAPEPSPSVAGELLRAPKASTERPWVLLVGVNEVALDKAARGFFPPGFPVLSPSKSPPLPLAVEELPPPGIEGERALFVRRIELGLLDGPLSATSPLYVLPRLARLASEGAPLTFIATSIESELERRAKTVLAQRGLASRFEIRRVPGEPGDAVAPPPPLEPPEGALGFVFRAAELQGTDAVSALGRAIEIDPELPCAHYELGKALIQAEDIEGAVAEFRRTAELLPEYASAWGNLGAALGEMKDLAGASAALERAVALDPENAPLLSNLGVTLRDQGRYPEAESPLRRALELDPDFVFGHYNLAHTLFLAGRYPEAIETFVKAQSLDRGRSTRQALLLACARLASGDAEGAHREYRDVFARLSEPARREHRAVAEWDMKELARRTGITPGLREAASLLRSLV